MGSVERERQTQVQPGKRRGFKEHCVPDRDNMLTVLSLSLSRVLFFDLSFSALSSPPSAEHFSPPHSERLTS